MFYKQSNILFPLFIGIGIFLALLYIFKKLKKLDIDKKNNERLIVVFSYAGIAFYIGARVFDDLFHYLNGEGFGKGGITFLGGMISAIVVLVVLFLIFLKPLRPKFFKILNIVCMGIILGHAMGRIGCFCSGCCYGAKTTSFIGVSFPGDAKIYQNANKTYQIKLDASDAYTLLFNEKLDEVGFDRNKSYTDYNELNSYLQIAKDYASNTLVIPTQLIETIFLLILFSILLFIPKFQAPLYVIGYGIYRFFIEFIRYDNRGSTNLGISPSQLLSIIIVLAGVFCLILINKLQKLSKIEI